MQSAHITNTFPSRRRWWLALAAGICALVSPLAPQAQSNPTLWQTYMRAGISAYLAQRYAESEVLLQLALSEAEQQPNGESLVLVTGCVLHDVRAESQKNIVESGRCAVTSKRMIAPGPGLTDVAPA